MADGVSSRVKVLFGLVPLLMGLLILGALAGFVPIGEGAFFAPTWVTAAIGAGLILFAFLVWIPGSAPATLRSSLGVVALLLDGGRVQLDGVRARRPLHQRGQPRPGNADDGGSRGRSDRLRPGSRCHRPAPGACSLFDGHPAAPAPRLRPPRHSTRIDRTLLRAFVLAPSHPRGKRRRQRPGPATR